MSNDNIPRDAKVISLILRSQNIKHCSPKVILQLLEFSYKYVTDVLTDANNFADYCSRKNITADDVKLALQTRVGKQFVTPPPRQYMIDIAYALNSKPLVEYESENLVVLPDNRKSLMGLEYDITDDENDKIGKINIV